MWYNMDSTSLKYHKKNEKSNFYISMTTEQTAFAPKDHVWFDQKLQNLLNAAEEVQLWKKECGTDSI